MSSSLIRYALVCAAEARHPSPQLYGFPLDGAPPFEVASDDDKPWELDCNLASYSMPELGIHRFVLEGSYETLTLEISCRSAYDAALAYAGLLAASARFQ